MMGASDVDRGPRLLSICTGIGGLDLGVGLALPGARTVCMVEGEAACVEVLASRMEDGRLHPAPIWTNARTFDGRPWRGRVHGIVAGYPCQPFSVAGKRQGADDPRHLWPEILRIAGEVGPEFLFLENVAGHIRLGLDRVLGDLAEVGFDAEWTTVRASDVGAPHRRERVFILAYRRGGRFKELWRGCLLDRERQALGHDAHGFDQAVADAEGSGRRDYGVSRDMGQAKGKEGFPGDRPAFAATGSKPTVADASDDYRRAGERRTEEGARPHGERRRRSTERSGEIADAERMYLPRRRGPGELAGSQGTHQGERDQRKRHGDADHDRQRYMGHTDSPGLEGWGRPIGQDANECAAWPPGPEGDWSGIPKHLWPATQPELRGMADGLPGRVDRLRALGNAVVPQQAALALRQLISRIEQ